MNKLLKLFIGGSLVALVPVATLAAGTYYNGSYQSPQAASQRYNPSGYARQQPQGYYQNTGYQNAGTYSSAGYSRYGQMTQPQQNAAGRQNAAQQQRQTSAGGTKTGFSLDASITRETAMWQFEMKQSGSMLHYDNIAWNVFNAQAAYVFDMGNSKGQLDAGFRYGMQSGKSTMVDDDITKGGYLVTEWVDNNNNVIGKQIGHALSAGSSKGGDMMGFNVGFGLTDFFTMGKTKITPSIGYRYFSHTLKTEQNFGLSVDTAQCFEVNGEIQCDPAVVIHYSDGTQQILWRDNINDPLIIAGTGTNATVDPQGTYYYQQPGVSHKYDVTWAGPYIALEMLYEINQNNSVNASAELGLPGYTSTGDQPYRFDWAHPKSIEDKAGMGSAMHFGLGANWRTAVTDAVMLSVGLTYDYYSVSGANAKTYLSESHYMGIYNDRLGKWQAAGKSEADMISTADVNQDGLPDGDPDALNVLKLKEECPGWVCSTNSEINSFYKSMGIRVGINARF
jgi:hypothetical protein